MGTLVISTDHHASILFNWMKIVGHRIPPRPTQKLDMGTRFGSMIWKQDLEIWVSEYIIFTYSMATIFKPHKRYLYKCLHDTHIYMYSSLGLGPGPWISEVWAGVKS